ncbi:MAG: Txe/YoeB family addiction module toxin [Sphingobacteriales bacterium]|nr:MAG: Txe/YoeB family addiction module toxin [Sphingobacteriales bacterium]TAF78552.1 MAG: Txe/YoeB family addiction module toxin [Sphingobacteriales bacterium]
MTKKWLNNARAGGAGKPEPLKHDLSGKWSRRINQEHRLVYEVHESIVKAHSAKGYYK